MSTYGGAGVVTTPHMTACCDGGQVAQESPSATREAFTAEAPQSCTPATAFFWVTPPKTLSPRLAAVPMSSVPPPVDEYSKWSPATPLLTRVPERILIDCPR